MDLMQVFSGGCKLFTYFSDVGPDDDDGDDCGDDDDDDDDDDLPTVPRTNWGLSLLGIGLITTILNPA
jgi:hypothetical protein